MEMARGEAAAPDAPVVPGGNRSPQRPSSIPSPPDAPEPGHTAALRRDPMTKIGSMARVSSPIFVGRTVELDRLQHALEVASEGRAAMRVIAGDAGIGKTRLVEEFGRRAGASGARVLIGACLPLGESGPAYAPLVAALRPVVRSADPEDLDRLVGHGRAELAQLLPDLGTGEGRRERRREGAPGATAAQARLFEVVFGLLSRLAADRTVVLILEDLHWADTSTLDLLRFLVGASRSERLMLLATYRSDELHRRHPLRPFLAEIGRQDLVDRIELGAFDADEIAEQLGGIRGTPPAPALVERVFARSGGNPFFAEELLAAGDIGLTLPRTLRDTLGDRVRRLSDDAQRLMGVASVGGARVGHEVLARVIGWPEGRLTDAIREVVEHHLLVPTSPEEAPAYAFRHALLQEVVYEDLLPSERTGLHAAYAEAIAAVATPGDRPATTAKVAHHWLMAHDLERALIASIDAARAASDGFAFAESRVFLERALELWEKVRPESIPEGLDRVRLLQEAAEAAAQAGDARRSIDLVRSALAALDPREDAMRAGVLQHRLAWYLNEAGDWQAGVGAMERAVELIPIDPPTEERARVLADLAHSLMGRTRYGESLALAEAALAISRTIGNRMGEARALNVIGLDLACRSDFARAVPMLRAGHDRSVQLDEPVAVFLTGVGLTWGLDASARHAEALEVARATRDHIRRLGADARFGGQLASVTARSLYFLGRWDESAALIDSTLAAGTTRYAVRWLLSNRLRLRAGRGEIEEGRADIATYETLGERVIGPDPDLMGLRTAELAIAAGDPSTARTIVRDVLARMSEPDLDNDARLLLVMGLQAAAEEADAARAAGDERQLAEAVDGARDFGDRLEAHVRRVRETVGEPAPIVGADLALGIALVHRAMGSPDIGVWDDAVAQRRVVGRPYELALALVQAAAVHLHHRRREDGALALAEAHAIATDLGAGSLRDRIESLARRGRIGLEGVDTAEDTADRLGLTRREREVLALLADGRSNRQIGEQLYMAESTAGVHVSNILGKLGVTRRSEAAALAHRLGLLGIM
jgi:DNA-binding CsgD family transcriptional regulator/tetratricopeptide (TPR) repeat protein